MGGLLLMIRLLLVLFTLVGFLIFSYPFLVAQVSLGKKDPHARDLETIKVVRSVFKVLLKLAGVTVTVKGAENIPEDTAVLYVGNHRSYFDILAGYTTVPTLLGFVAKRRWKKIPLLRTDGERELPVLRQKEHQRRLKDDPSGNREGKKRRFHLDFPGGNEKSERRYHGATSV